MNFIQIANYVLKVHATILANYSKFMLSIIEYTKSWKCDRSITYKV